MSALAGSSAARVTVFAEQAPDVIIDAGHGGIDGGAVGTAGTPEKDVNLAIALRLQARLEKDGFRVLMIRATDRSIHDASAVTTRQKKTSDLKNRLAISARYPSAVYVSIHQNSYPSAKVQGTTLYYGPKNSCSEAIAKAVRAAVLQQLQPDNKRVMKQAGGDLYILSNTAAPAVLVECGFLSNSAEEALLTTPVYQQAMANAIADGLEAYYSNLIGWEK